MDNDRFTLNPRLASVLIWLVLSLMIVYHVGLFYSGYFPGFYYSSSSGEVLQIFVDEEETELHLGDKITSIDSITLEDYYTDPYLQLWEDLKPGDTVLIEVERAANPASQKM